MCQVCHDPVTGRVIGIDPCLCGAPATQAAFARIAADLDRRRMMGGAAAVVGLFAGFGLGAGGADAQPAGQPLRLRNLRFFDGQRLEMHTGHDILIDGNRIAGLPRADDAGPDGARVIDCSGRAVIPGLIDAHWHATLVGVTQTQAMAADIGFVHLMAGREAGATLRRGFTTVRDTGGPAFGLKQAIDAGALPGPRIFASGAMISQTSGHGDFRLLSELPRRPDDLSYPERAGVAAIADGRDEVLRRTREQLMKGASQIKIMAGGGVTSVYDPLESLQFTEDEMRAAVQAASDWGTYVCAHVYTPAGIQRCLRAGVRSIEHGQLADLDTVRMMRDEGAWWSIQPFLGDADANPRSNPAQQAKGDAVARGTVQAFEMGRAEGVNMAFGTDVLMNPAGAATQGRQLAKLTRFMTPLEALRMATGAAGELLAMSGDRAPYAGPLGVIAPGALADLLVVDADPEAGLDWLDTPDDSLAMILKDGRIVTSRL